MSLKSTTRLFLWHSSVTSVVGCLVGFMDDKIQMAKTCRTEDLFNLSGARRRNNPSEHHQATEECLLFYAKCPQPPLLGLPDLKTPLKGGCSHSRAWDWGLERRLPQLPLVLLGVRVLISPRGSGVTSNQQRNGDTSLLRPLSPPTGLLAACVVMETGRQQSSSGLGGKLSPNSEATGRWGPSALRPEHMVSAARHTSAGSCCPTVLMFTPSRWDGGPTMWWE